MKFSMKIIFTLILSLLISCGEGKRPLPDWPWDDPQEEPNTEDPDNPDNPDEPEDPNKPGNFKGKPRYIWIDAPANFYYYANSKETIIAELAKIKKMGFTDIIVDVRPTNSGVLFKSTVEHPLTKVDAWVKGNYRWVERTEDFDYLGVFIEEGHKVGLRVNAAINTFVGGARAYYNLGPDGFIFDDPNKKSWATVIYSKHGRVNTLDLQDPGVIFLNPANDEVVEYLINLIAELAAYKNLDGIVLDRCRYGDYGLQSDFSEISREKFEAYIGYKLSNFPDDILPPDCDKHSVPNPATPLQKLWLEFRAKTIHDFVEKASAKVKQVNPKVRFGAYVGGWYSSYYPSGVNWASPKYDPKIEGAYFWASENYKKYGYADHCDFMMIGAYAGVDHITGSTEWTMQGFCTRAANLFKKDVVFAGGPDIGNGTGFENGGKGYLMPKIVTTCINAADGLFIFDLCHIRMYDYWDAFENAINQYEAGL